MCSLAQQTAENMDEINIFFQVTMRNPRAVAVTSVLKWRPRHGLWYKCISLVQFINGFPEKKPGFEQTHAISDQVQAAGILITTAFDSS